MITPRSLARLFAASSMFLLASGCSSVDGLANSGGDVAPDDSGVAVGKPGPEAASLRGALDGSGSVEPAMDADARTTPTDAHDAPAPVDASTGSFAPIRIACGQTAPVTDAFGNVWSADEDYVGGTALVSTDSVSGTPSPALYYGQRYGATSTAFHYTIAVPAGTYTVLLKFDESYFTGDAGTGERLFNVSINGEAVLQSFDIYAAAGNNLNTAVDRSFPVTLGSGGAITLDFDPVVQDPRVDAIQVTGGQAASQGDSGVDAGQEVTHDGGMGHTDASSSSSDFITASGTNLMLNGKVFQFIGFDAYGMTGCFNGTAWTVEQLDAYFAGLPENGMTRLWAMQYWGTAAISTIVGEAAKYNQHLILVLGNDDGNCDPTTDDPNQTGEPLSFYESGWQGEYVSWVDTLVPLFKDNPTVGMWEIANEPGQATTVPENTMAAYLAGAAAAIKAVDSNHLVESGINDVANVGNFQTAQAGADIDVLSFHDYAWDYEGMAIESGNFTAAQAAAVALNKPFIAGEAGVESGPTCTADLTESQRVTYLQTKANDYFEGKAPNGTTGPAISGVMFWEYEPVNTYGWSNGECEYDLFAGDPLIGMVQGYVVP
jgi:Malectin domain/Cellulase (glycosyl hydrolase family 5)